MTLAILSRRQIIVAALSSVASFFCAPAKAALPGTADSDGDQIMANAGFTRYQPPGTSHRIYRGGKGPAVLILHEIPGLYPADIDLASRVAKCGFTAVIPVFFGKPGDDHAVRNLLFQCFVPFTQFHCWIPDVTSRAAHWLAKLVPELHRECGGKGVGVIGMCLTGSLPLALIRVPEVKAAVLCQPTNPFVWKHSLDISKDDLQAAIERRELTVLAIKFSGDGKSPHQRFETLRKKFTSHFSELIIKSGKEGSALGRAQHSVLGGDYDHGPTAAATREAFDRVIRYLDERLSDPPTRSPYPQPKEICPPEMFTSCQSYQD